MVLDGLVISAPSLSPGVIISDGKAEISGTFDRESAATLANQLNFGALPLTFEVQSEEQISATLGSEQLQKGLIAGVIGLVLVAIYSLFQYRALGLVTIASLLVAGPAHLRRHHRAVVGAGLPAEPARCRRPHRRDRHHRRLLHRLLRAHPRRAARGPHAAGAAVDRGWERARRTILASDAVSFLAAIVLYFLAVGGVRGFAFTLGLTTLLDLLVVFLFTRPVMAAARPHPVLRRGPRVLRPGPAAPRCRGPALRRPRPGRDADRAPPAGRHARRAGRRPRPSSGTTHGATATRPTTSPRDARRRRRQPPPRRRRRRTRPRRRRRAGAHRR